MAMGLVCVSAILPAAVFAAAAVPTTGSGTPAPWSFVDITAEYLNEDATYCLVGGELPTTTPLPAPVEIAVPASSTPQWVGEVVAANPAADKQLPYEIERRGSMDVYSLTVQGSRLAQVEALVPGLITLKDGTYTVAVSWVAPAATPRCRISAALPGDAQVVEPAQGAQTAKASGGSIYYYRDVADVKAGDEIALNFTYKVPEVQAQQPSAAGGSPTLFWVILGVGLVVVVVLLVVVVRQRRSASDDDSPGSTEV